MRQADEKEIRFKLRRGLQGLDRTLLKNLAGAADKKEIALKIAEDILWQQLSRYSFEAPDPLEGHNQKRG